MNKEVYKIQNEIFKILQSSGLIDDAKLCGGTALARFWLDHRISYDLDFFMPNGFSPKDFLTKLKSLKIHIKINDILEDDKNKASQIHGFIAHKDGDLKISFIEDAYYDVYPPVIAKMSGISVLTESIEGLYHRKLRTIVGYASSDDDVPVGGRQKARDVFDLSVLSEKHKKISDFIQEVPYTFPEKAFINGLSSMPWHELAHELSEIDSHQDWVKFKSIDTTMNFILEQAGFDVISEDDEWWNPKP